MHGVSALRGPIGIVPHLKEVFLGVVQHRTPKGHCVSFPGAVGPHDGFQLYVGGLLHLPGKSGMVLDLGIIHKKV